MPRLRSLALSDNGRISSDGLAMLADSPHLGGLRALDVSGNAVGDEGIRETIRSRYLSQLHTFRVHGNCVGDAGVITLL